MPLERLHEFQARFEKAIRNAEPEFWSVIVEEYPEVQTGEFPPDAVRALNRALEEALATWLHYNYPNQTFMKAFEEARDKGFLA